MPSTIKTLKNTTYDTVRTSSFTKIHGRLTRSDYENLKKEAADLARKRMTSHTLGHVAQ
jgi:hypothetical protein